MSASGRVSVAASITTSQRQCGTRSVGIRGGRWTALGAASLMAAAAALEVTVHGWDVSRACGQRQPIPRALATALLVLAPALVPRAGRHPLFAAPVTVAATAGPSDRLAAFLGRTPQA